ncbi:hypothetical protein BGZ46_003665, partial [Entomortierella lignicola]
MPTGKIEYMFTASGKRSFPSDIEVHRVVEIYQSLPPTHPHCIYPQQLSADFEGALNYFVQIPRKAFHHGAAIPITVRMNPLPGSHARWHVKSMHVEINEYFWFISPGKGVKDESRTLMETYQGAGSWPIHSAPVERTIPVNLPTVNIMSTTDTEVVKCSHKLKITFSIDVNGHYKKLTTDFDLYIPGPFPPGQGPIALPMASTQQATVPQAQHQQQQLPPSSYAANPYSTAMPTPIVSPTGYPTPTSGQTSSSPFMPPSSPFSPPATPQHQQQYGQQQLPSYSTASTPSSTPGLAAAHPYSQGYPTPTASNNYPMATSSSQGYPGYPPMPSPTAASSLPYPVPSSTTSSGYPPMPSPTVASSHHPMPSPTVVSNHGYPMPPSPALGYAQSQSSMVPSPRVAHIPMPIPSPNLGSTLISGAATNGVSSPVVKPGTPVMGQQQQFVSSSKVEHPVVTSNGRVLQIDDSIKVDYNFDDTIKVEAKQEPKFDDTIKVSLDDIKLPSTPSTPSKAYTNSPKNPQEKRSSLKSPLNGNIGIGSAAGSDQSDLQTKGDAIKNQSFILPPQPNAPHAIKEPEDPIIVSDFAYQPPPSSNTAPVKTEPTPKPLQQNDLAHQLNRMSLSAPVPPVRTTSATSATYPLGGGISAPVVMTTSSSSCTQSPPPASAPSPVTSSTAPSSRPTTTYAANSASYQNPLSPVSSGTFINSQLNQQHQHKPPYQAPLPTMSSISQP